jgi:carboxypeptidase C (cathepsin A)
LYSMLYSKGPFTLMWNSTDFRHNPNNWNKEANVVFIEAPAQTGFSLGPIKSSDYELAEDNVKALVSFFTKFPHLKDQDLFLAGEGYSGVMVPWLASRIIEWN